MVFIGFNLTFFPQFLVGYLGMPRRYHMYPPEFQVFNVLSTARRDRAGGRLPAADGLLHATRSSAAKLRRPIRGARRDWSGRSRRRRRPRTSR